MSKASPSLMKNTIKEIEWLNKIGQISDSKKTCIKTIFERYSNIIHCKDCGHRDHDTNYCYLLDRYVDIDNHCSWAERRGCEK